MITILVKILKWLTLSIATLLVIGFLYEQASQYYYNPIKLSPEYFKNINGANIHFVKKGSGGPTVVFQSGLGGDYKIWQQIQDSVSTYTTTLSYDRAGLLWSDAAPGQKTMANITAELYQLLEKTNCPKPYILVGHSLAGITLREFVKEHPQDVAGLVFVDVAHPLQIKNSSAELRKYLIVPPKWLMTILVETGLIRTYFHFKPFIADLPADHWMNLHIRDYFYTAYKTMLQEAHDDDAMFEQAEKINSFGSIPLTIISGAYPDGATFIGKPAQAKEYLDLHRKQQKDLLNLSTNSRQLIAPHSGHYVPLQDADLVIEAIKEQLNTRK